MKKFLLLFLCLVVVQFTKAQTSNYDFTAVNDAGITLYYKITSEANREVELADNNTWNAYKTLTKLVIPDKVKNAADHDKEYTVVSVGSSFTWSSGNLLTELTFPNTLKRFEWQSLAGLISIKKLTIPASVTYYVGLTIQGLSSLEELEILSPIPATVKNYWTIFNIDLTKLSIYLPIDCSAAYKSDPKWVGDMGGTPIPYLERITLNANGYASLYLENENCEVPAGCTAYIVKGSKQGAGSYPDADIKAFAAGSIIPKQTAFILENLNAKGQTIGYHAHVSGIEVDVSGNLLVGSATETEFSGTGYRYYIFSSGSLGQGFYHQGTRKGESIKVKAHRAGLRLPVTGYGLAPAKAFVFDFEAAKQKLITGISVHPTTDAAPKNDVIYDLQGRRVTHPTRGIYIVNGKKIMFN